ncbi:hypothetical protein [Thiohalomonas denitrificans]|uniref:hypothetical protein n=1 Tax=Thiohalomonas denitrificans TaxID=415747 RepID=UPI0026EE536F|nr:hypothetical protein [Thiohalomonas denitrificans]
MLFPFAIRAAFLGDYTKGRFTLGGSLGINQEDYTRTLNGSEISRRELEKEAAIDMAGFIWDPRFLSFSTGVTVTDIDTETSGEDTDRQAVGYHLETTWFGNRDHPLNIFAHRRKNSVANFSSPSYDLTTERYGLGWGFQRQLLGNIKARFEVIESQSESSEVDRDETREIVEFEGKRQIKRESGSHSNITYGFREIDSEDSVLGTAARQRDWYAYDRTEFGKTTSLISSIKYYDREDVWSNSDEGIPLQIESSFMNASSSLRMQSSELLRQHYSLALSRSDSNTSESNRYDLRGGVVYNIAPHWELETDVGLNGGDYRSETTHAEDLFAQLEAGVRYNRHFESIGVRAGYSAEYGSELESNDSDGRGDTTAQTANLGLSRRTNVWWEDAIDYRVRTEEGEHSNREHTIHYLATSRLGPSDQLRFTADWRHYKSDYLLIRQKTEDLRYKADWNHRLGAGNTFSLGLGHTKTESGDSAVERSFVQGRVGLSPRQFRRLRFNGSVHFEKEVRLDVERTNLRAEASVVYPVGRWETRAVYRYREYDDENTDFGSSLDEQSIMFYLRRHFGIRF